MQTRHSNSLLLALLNSLSDFDGYLSDKAVRLLNELAKRSDRLPPLYADVFGLSESATCQELVKRIQSLSQHQVAVASYAFQIFHSYEQMLRRNTAVDVAPEQQAAYESQLERLRVVVARTKYVLAKSIEDVD